MWAHATAITRAPFIGIPEISCPGKTYIWGKYWNIGFELECIWATNLNYVTFYWILTGNLLGNNLYFGLCYHSWNPRLIKGGRTFQKLSHLAGEVLPKVLLERGDNSEKGGWYKNGLGGCHFFITLQFNCIYSARARACVCVCVCVCVSVCGVKFVSLHFDSSFFWVYHTRFSSNTL